MWRRQSLVLALLVLICGLILPISAALANDVSSSAGFRKAVKLDGVREHQAALQAIASANGGTRAAGTPGYDASAAYVAGLMEDAGYIVTIQEFQFQTFIELSPTVLERVSPPPAGPIATAIMEYSGSGDVTAPVTALAAPPADATPGCEAGDFAGFPAGRIALISRGACTFAIKTTNAYNAGAAAALLRLRRTSGGGRCGSRSSVPASAAACWRPS